MIKKLTMELYAVCERLIPSKTETLAQRTIKSITLIASAVLCGCGVHRFATKSGNTYPWFLGSFVPLAISLVTSYLIREKPLPFFQNDSAQQSAKVWSEQLEPLNDPLKQKARDYVINLFAFLTVKRREIMVNSSDSKKWRGFVFYHEVYPAYKTNRIPERLLTIYNSPLVQEKHENLFDIRKFIKAKKIKSIFDLINLIETPLVIDCGGVTSLLQMAACSIFDRKFSLANINAMFLGIFPRIMVRALENGLDSHPYLLSGEDSRRLWNDSMHPFDPEREAFIEIFDMCYLENDLRYQEENSDKSAFKSNKFQGVGSGWWLTYIGNNHNGERVYLGFGGDDGPMTLDAWKELLRIEFQEKWREIPSDLFMKPTYYKSPIRNCQLPNF